MNYLTTDEHEEAVAALEMCARLSPELAASGESSLWKWILISLHSAVQGFMVLALRGSNGFAVLKPKNEQQWLQAYRAGTQTPEEELDSFLGLYGKVKGERMLAYVYSQPFSASSTHDSSMVRLNRLRNQFIHFLPRSWTLDLSDIPPVLSNCLSLASFLVDESGNIRLPNTELRGRYAIAVAFCRAAFAQLRDRQAQTGVPPNDGPATPIGNSDGSEGGCHR